VEFKEDGTGTVTFTLLWEGPVSGASNRSVAGVSGADIKNTERIFRNVYQLIVVDINAPDKVWRFAEVRYETRGKLSVVFNKGYTYHFLFLCGNAELDLSIIDGFPAQPGTGNGRDGTGNPVYTNSPPTLLASGYKLATMSQDTSLGTLSVVMTPLVADTAFVPSTGSVAGTRHIGRMAKTVGLDERTAYTFRVT
jgi:hypothetical protein